VEALEKDGQNVWISVTKIRAGVTGGFYSSVIPDINIVAREWAEIQQCRSIGRQ
jgi:hypothetical protein